MLTLTFPWVILFQLITGSLARPASDADSLVLENEPSDFKMAESLESSSVDTSDKFLVRPRFIYARTRKDAQATVARMTVSVSPDEVGDDSEESRISAVMADETPMESRHSGSVMAEGPRVTSYRTGVANYDASIPGAQTRAFSSVGSGPTYRPRKRPSQRRKQKGRGANGAGSETHKEQVEYHEAAGDIDLSEDSSEDDGDGYSSVSTIGESDSDHESESDPNDIDDHHYGHEKKEKRKKKRPAIYPPPHSLKSHNRNKLYGDGLLIYLKDFHYGGLGRK
ncbi:hypothetical protein HDE_00423 [Halotydeus destructor]|nr:hypothetical protein HDE_00423 [Halotydeus destructor]